MLLAIARIASADGSASLADGLAMNDPHAVADAVATIERGSADAALLYAAGRACEDKLADPARALAIYERILRDDPGAAAAVAAEQRAAELRPIAADPRARDLAALRADADRLVAADAIARGDALAAADWPGAREAALWLADWLRRTGRYADAEARYAAVIAKWPDSPQAKLAARGAAGCALDAHDWARAAALAAKLPAIDRDDRLVRDELLQAARRGRGLAHFGTAATIALVLAIAALVASLIEAAARGGWRRPSFAPPVELWFAVPIAAVLVGVAATAHRLIFPAVVRISLVGLALAWLSATTIALLRARGRATRLRSLLHVGTCAVAVIAVAYLALAHDGLLDLLVDTVRFGPE
ncbi:MAG TPA: tetratricopeptide repeat protein [Kofleriaceae bacterium]